MRALCTETFLASYEVPRACAADGPTASERGLRQVATNARLDWEKLHQASTGDVWVSVLDENLNAVLGAGLWGVPSFHVTGGPVDDSYARWRQDRIWRVGNDSARHV